MKNVGIFLFSLFCGIAFMFIYTNKKKVSLKQQTKIPITNISPYSIQNAPSASSVGTILSLSGDVNWQSRTATISSPLHIPISILQGEEIDTQGTGIVSIQFPHLLITISPNTTMQFIQTLSDNTVITQNTGKAEYITTTTIPLSIKSIHLLIQQTTGDSVVTTDSNQQSTTISVKKGDLTTAYNDLQNTTILTSLTEGEKYIFHDDTRNGQVYKTN